MFAPYITDALLEPDKYTVRTSDGEELSMTVLYGPAKADTRVLLSHKHGFC